LRLSPWILSPFAFALTLALAASPARAEDHPQLAWDTTVRCLQKPNGEQVRVQCSVVNGEQRCLVAPNQMPFGGEQNRVQDCGPAEETGAYAKLVAGGAHMIPALAEAPPGYARSETGRAYQVKFDLLNRVFVGVDWIPTFGRLDLLAPSSLSYLVGRAQASMGLSVSVLSPRHRARHDLRILEGSVTFSDLELKGLLFAYDYQHEHRRPTSWISTFVGEPRVYDVTPALGWGFRLLNVNDRPPAFRNTFDLEVAEGHLAWSPWQSNDMYSHIRLEAGGDFGKYWPDRGEVFRTQGSGRWYGGLTAALRSRFSIGEGGLHYLFVDVNYFRPTLFDGAPVTVTSNRVDATLAYEGVFVAINDQPLSLRLAATGGSRDDPDTGARSVELRFSAGLRFSLWAPPRVFEPMPAIEDP